VHAELESASGEKRKAPHGHDLLSRSDRNWQGTPKQSRVSVLKVGDTKMEQGAAEIIQCSNCGARNRIPVERLQTRAKCGRCQAPLARGKQDGPGITYVLRCSECGAKNRIHSSKLDDQPKCGKCHARLKSHELLEPQPIMITDHNFSEKVLKSPLPVLLFAMSPTCPGCGQAAPHIEAFARESKGKIRVGKLNIQHNPALASKFDILSVPYLLIFDQGKLQKSMPGGLDKRGLMELMMHYLY
jgi:thioredoxin 2